MGTLQIRKKKNNLVFKLNLSLEEVTQLGLEPMTSELYSNSLKTTFSSPIFYLDSAEHKIARTVANLTESILRQYHLSEQRFQLGMKAIHHSL